MPCDIPARPDPRTPRTAGILRTLVRAAPGPDPAAGLRHVCAVAPLPVPKSSAIASKKATKL